MHPQTFGFAKENVWVGMPRAEGIPAPKIVVAVENFWFAGVPRGTSRAFEELCCSIYHNAVHYRYLAFQSIGTDSVQMEKVLGSTQKEY